MLQWHAVHGLAYVIILMTRMILLRFVLEPERRTVNNIIWIVPASPVIIMDRHR